LKDIALAIENYKMFDTFLNNIDTLYFAGSIERSVGKRDGLQSAHAWSVLTGMTLHNSGQTKCSYKQVS
jgi:hypothetical protein